MRRRWYRLRRALHDWMWDGGAQPSLPRRTARRLPLHFTDPDWMSPRKVRRLTDGGVTARPSGIRVTNGANCTFANNTFTD